MNKREFEALIREYYPHAYHLFDELDKVCGIIKTQNRGRGHVAFDAQGIDIHGNLIVKCFDAGLKFFRKAEQGD